MSTTIDSVVLSVRDGQPAINVRDENLWARDPRTAKAIAQLSEYVVERIYEGVQHDFWWGFAANAAAEFGYGDVWQDGRSGGWLIVSERLDFLEHLDADDPWADPGFLAGNEPGEDTGDEGEMLLERTTTAAIAERDKFLEFARVIKAEQNYCEEQFVEQLNEELTDESHIVRGES